MNQDLELKCTSILERHGLHDEDAFHELKYALARAEVDLEREFVDDTPEPTKRDLPGLSAELEEDLFRILTTIIDTPVCEAEQAEALKLVLYRVHCFHSRNRNAEEKPLHYAIRGVQLNLYQLWCQFASPGTSAHMGRSISATTGATTPGTALGFVSDCMMYLSQHVKGLHRQPKTIYDHHQRLMDDLKLDTTMTTSEMNDAIDALALDDGSYLNEQNMAEIFYAGLVLEKR